MCIFLAMFTFYEILLNWSARVGNFEIYPGRAMIVCALVVVMFVGYIL